MKNIINLIHNIMAKNKIVTEEIKTGVCTKCSGIGRLAPHTFYHIESCDACKGTGIEK